MKWIQEPIKGTGYSEVMFALNQTDIEVLRPVFERSLSEYRKLYDKYEDIRQSGEATERQLNLWTKYSNIVGKLECLVKMTVF
ncbi:MAG: hypothetical protein IKM12_00310 [Alistipes sp.]|nr:hypothetical protein [Alistipes sp.]